MKRALLVLALAVIVVALAGCARKEVKPPSLSSKIAIEAFELSERMKDAYTGKNNKALEKLSTPSGFRELIGAIKKFDKAALVFTPRRVEIRDTDVRLTIAWSGKWSLRGRVTAKKGTAVFRLSGKPLKFAGLIKGNPFIYP